MQAPKGVDPLEIIKFYASLEAQSEVEGIDDKGILKIIFQQFLLQKIAAWWRQGAQP